MQSSEKKLEFKDLTAFLGLRVFGGIIVAHLLTTFFAFFASVLEDFMGEFLVNFIITGIGLVLLISYSYGVGWRQGLRDLSLESRGVLKYTPKKGLLAGILGVLPYIVFTGIYAVLFYTVNVTDYKWIVQLLNPEFVLFFDVPYMIPVVYVICIFAVLLGYVYGYKNISFVRKVVYQKQQDKK